MAFTVQTDEGLLSANSYVDVAFASSHLLLSGDLDIWSAKTEDQQKDLLVYASLTVDDLWDWRGLPVLAYPGLRFPRTELKDRDKRLITGIPRALKEGVAEMALYFALNDPFADNDLAGIAAMQVDILSIKFSDASTKSKSRYPASTMAKLAQFGDGTVGVGRRVVEARVI